jgi:hypothetical protein
MSRHMGLGSPGGDTKRLTATAPPKALPGFSSFCPDHRAASPR